MGFKMIRTSKPTNRPQIRVDNTTNTPSNSQLSYIVFGGDNTNDIEYLEAA